MTCSVIYEYILTTGCPSILCGFFLLFIIGYFASFRVVHGGKPILGPFVFIVFESWSASCSVIGRFFPLVLLLIGSFDLLATPCNVLVLEFEVLGGSGAESFFISSVIHSTGLRPTSIAASSSSFTTVVVTSSAPLIVAAVVVSYLVLLIVLVLLMSTSIIVTLIMVVTTTAIVSTVASSVEVTPSIVVLSKSLIV